MKKIIVSILLLFFIAHISYGQSYLGIRGGFSLTSLSTASASSRMGGSIGGMYSTRLSENWYFQPSLLFSLNGAKDSKHYKPDYSAYFYSVEAPLMFSLRFGDEDVSVGVDMGAFVRYGLFGHYWADSEDGRIEPNLFDYQKRFDAGPQVGFSAMVSGLYIGYSFQFGVIKPWNNLRGNYFASSINLGYLFELP